jgi:hemolysin activation/secretion protein
MSEAKSEAAVGLLLCRLITMLATFAIGSLPLSTAYASNAEPSTPAQAQQNAAPRRDAPAPSEQTFPITEFRVLGNHVLDRIKVESAVYPYLGNDRTIKTVEQARDALVAAYRQAGYGTVLVDIPEQTVDEGIVRLQVTEGTIEKVRIAGARYYSDRRILAALPSITPGTVPKLPELQTELGRLANEARDRQITPILKAGSAPGTVAVDLRVKDHVPLHGSIGVDDRYTADTTHTRLNASLSYDNMFQRGESLSVQYQMSPSAPSEVKLWVLSYLGHTLSPQWTWSVYGLRSESNVAAIGTLSVIGNGKVFGGRLIDTFGGDSGSVNSLTLGVDYKNFGQNVVLPSDVNAPTPIHYVLWSAQLATTRLHEHYDFQNSLALNFGLRGIAGNDAEFEFKRYGGSASYAYLRGSSNLTWRTWRGFALTGRLAFQYSAQPLVNNEQFSLGGEDSVRGYLEAEELVDAGVAAAAELHFPRLVLGRAEAVGYFFYDRGIGMNQQPLPGEIVAGTARTDLASFGVGFHAAFYGANATLELAEPRLTGSRTRRDDGRLHFSVLYGF